MSAKPDGRRSLRPVLNDVLTTVIHGATPFITTFLLVHLSAPIMANLGGSTLASQTMLLGREYYQTPYGEAALVLGPITAHALAGVLKRVLSKNKTKSPRGITDPLAATGYAMLLLWWPVHYLTHRMTPKTTAPPIDSVGPAELDMEFVKYGLKTWPLRSTVLYTGLLVATTVHVAHGMGIVAWLRSLFGRSKEDKERRATIGIIGVVVPVLAGLFVMAREPLMIFPSIASRYHAVFNKHFIYRI